jgi:hypothetical protein
MRATTWTLTLSTLLALLAGLMFSQPADAETFRPRQYSESDRLKARDRCRAGGGTSFDTAYHYEYGTDVPTSVTTTCHGGAHDGETCTIGGSQWQVTCTKSHAPTTETGGVPTDAVIEPTEADPSTTTADPAGGSGEVVWTGAVATGGVIVAIEADDENGQ